MILHELSFNKRAFGMLANNYSQM